jgi:ribose transport system substrate-binding protein
MNTLEQNRRRSMWLVIAVASLAALVGAATAAVATAKAKQKLIGVSNPIASIPGQQAFIYGAKQAAAHYGFALKVLDANLSADKQVSDIDTFISQHVDGITSWTLDPGATDAAYKRASRAGISLVGFNSASPFFSTVIKTDTDSSCAPIADAARYIATRASKAKVFVIGGPPVPSITFSVNCFLDAAKKLGLQIVSKKDNVNDTSPAGQRLTQDALTRHPDLQAIWSFDDVGGIGASAALRAGGKPIWSGNRKGVILIGKDGDTAAVAAIKSGAYTATYDENPTLAGAASIAALAVRLVDGKRMPKDVRVPFTRYDSSNASRYIDPLKRSVTFQGKCLSVATGARSCIGR